MRVSFHLLHTPPSLILSAPHTDTPSLFDRPSLGIHVRQTSPILRLTSSEFRPVPIAVEVPMRASETIYPLFEHTDRAVKVSIAKTEIPSALELVSTLG